MEHPHATDMPQGLAARLTASYLDDDPHRRAAVELLVWHQHWLRSRAFFDAAVSLDDEAQPWIRWRDARRAFDASMFVPASTSELAVLDLAIALGEDRYRLANMGHKHAAAIVQAVTAAASRAGDDR